MIAPSTPIEEALAELLTKAEREALVLPTACRTAGDLAVCIKRGEVEASAAVLKKLKKGVE